MNTAWIDSASTDLPSGDSSTDDNDTTQTRAAALSPRDRPPIAAIPIAAIPIEDIPIEDIDEPPIVRLVRAREQRHAIARPAPIAAEDRSAALPIAVLTNDPAFADQIRSALDGASVTAISTVDEAAALAACGRCPIVVTDTMIARNALATLTRRLHAHDPATAIVVSGNRDQAGMFIGLQSSGAVDAFLLKPITGAATQLVIEAATQRYRSYASAASQRVRPHEVATTSMPVEKPLKQRLHASWPLVAIVAVLVAGVVAWGMLQRSSGIDPNEIIAKHLASAEAAFAAQRLVDARNGAAHHYQTVLEIDPQNLAAHRGLDAIARELSRQTQLHMSRQQLADAAISLARLRELQPSYAELPLLDAQLKTLQDSFVASYAAARAAVASVPPKQVSEAPKRRPAARSEPRQRQRSTDVPSDPKPIEAPAVRNEPAPKIAATPRDESHDELRVPVSRSADALIASLAPPRLIRPAIAPSPPPAVEPETSPARLPPAREPAKLIKYVPPQYPSEAHARSMEGWIEISMEIAPNGDVIAPRIEDGEKRLLFGRPALAAIRQWKYAPDETREAGKRYSVRVEFRME